MDVASLLAQLCDLNELKLLILAEHPVAGADHFANGLLMRRDIHSLFDGGHYALIQRH